MLFSWKRRQPGMMLIILHQHKNKCAYVLLLNVKYPSYYSVDLNNYLLHPWLLKQKRINNNKEIIVFGRSFLEDGKVNKPVSKSRMGNIEVF